MRLLAMCRLFLLSSLLTGCSEAETKQELSAKAFSAEADECLFDVRDRHFKYENSSHCNALGALISRFLDAGGGTPETPVKTALIVEQGLKTAWMARAVSASGGRWLKLW